MSRTVEELAFIENLNKHFQCWVTPQASAQVQQVGLQHRQSWIRVLKDHSCGCSLAWFRTSACLRSKYFDGVSCVFVSSVISFTIGLRSLLLLLLYIFQGFQGKFVWACIFLVFSRSFHSPQPFFLVVARLRS